MSLVNQMLRDLENQKQPSHQFDLRAVANNNLGLTQLALVLAISIIVVATYWWSNKDTGKAAFQNSLNKEEIGQSSQSLSEVGFKNDNLSVKAELSTPDAQKILKPQPKNQFATNSKLEKPTVIGVKQAPEIQPNSPPMKRDPVGKTAGVDAPKSESSVIPAHNSTPTQSLSQFKSKSRSESKSKSPEKTAATTTGVKQETLGSQLNRQLQKILASQNVVGIQQTIFQLDKLVKQNPQFEKAHLSLIKLGWQNEYDALEETLLFAIQQNPQQPAFRVAAARYYLQQKNYPKAESVIQAESAGTATSSNLLQVRALIYQKQDKHQLAVKDYALLLNRTKKKASVYLALAISLEALGEVDRAEQSYRNALRENQLNSRQVEFVRNKLLYLKG